MDLREGMQCCWHDIDAETNTIGKTHYSCSGLKYLNHMRANYRANNEGIANQQRIQKANPRKRDSGKMGDGKVIG